MATSATHHSVDDKDAKEDSGEESTGRVKNVRRRETKEDMSDEGSESTTGNNYSRDGQLIRAGSQSGKRLPGVNLNASDLGRNRNSRASKNSRKMKDIFEKLGLSQGWSSKKVVVFTLVVALLAYILGRHRLSEESKFELDMQIASRIRDVENQSQEECRNYLDKQREIISDEGKKSCREQIEMNVKLQEAVSNEKWEKDCSKQKEAVADDSKKRCAKEIESSVKLQEAQSIEKCERDCNKQKESMADDSKRACAKEIESSVKLQEAQSNEKCEKDCNRQVAEKQTEAYQNMVRAIKDLRQNEINNLKKLLSTIKEMSGEERNRWISKAEDEFKKLIFITSDRIETIQSELVRV